MPEECRRCPKTTENSRLYLRRLHSLVDFIFNIFLVREILPAYMKIRVNKVGYHEMSEKEPS